MDVSRPFLMTLILHFLTSLPLKRTLILANSLTSDPYNREFLKRRMSVLQTHSQGLPQLLLSGMWELPAYLLSSESSMRGKVNDP